MKRLRIWQKFTLIAIVFSIPIAVLAYLLVRETNKAIAFSAAEADGTEFFRPLRKLVIDVSTHRDLSAAVLGGDASWKAELDKKAEEVAADFKALEAVNAKYSVEFDLTDELKKVSQAWQALKGNLATMKVEQSFDEHARFLSGVKDFSILLGNASNLILDPDVDSYYCMDAIIFKIPKLTEEISRSRAIGAAYLAAGAQGEEGSRRRFQLAESVVRINDALAEENYFIRFGISFNQLTGQALGGGLSENSKAVKAYVAFLDKVVNGSDTMTVKDYFTGATLPIVEGSKLWDTTAAELDRLLEIRVGSLRSGLYRNLLIAAVALALSILLLAVVVRAITRPIAHLREVADKISLGDMDAAIHVDTKDEIGELADSFRRLQVSLKEAMDALERQSEPPA